MNASPITPVSGQSSSAQTSTRCNRGPRSFGAEGAVDSAGDERFLIRNLDRWLVVGESLGSGPD
jgi:hypothetical protein